MFDNLYDIAEFRVFTVPNLLKEATITETSPPWPTDWEGQRLLSNLDTRSNSKNYGPIIAWDGQTGGSRIVTRASEGSCY